MSDAKANILIVDDLPDKLLVYQTVLEELGQNVVSARSGAEALKLILRDDFAVILLDVNMPDIDGFETAHLIRQRKRSAHTPIIFLTSFADEVRIQQGYATGAVDYIPAPVIPEILRAKVRVFVELFRMRQQVTLQAEERAKRAAAEESARRSAFLAEASRALATTLDFDATLSTLVRSPIPQLADVCFVTQRNADGGRGTTLGAWLDPKYAVTADRKMTDLPPELTAMLAGVLDADVGKSLPRSFPLPFAPPTTGEDPVSIPLMSAVILPLVARGNVVGAMTFANGPSRGPMSLADVYLAEELSSRAAVALDNATLVRDIQEADQRKNEFLAMLAHELRNPLAPIRNAVHLLREHDNNAEDLRWARDIIDRQVTNLVRMVDDLLDVARINQGKIQLVMETLEANAVLARALETSRPVIEAHNHLLRVASAPKPAFLRGDVTRLSQVLSNLLNNAAKYTPNGGRIDAIVETDGADVVFRIRDNGRGIPGEQLNKVFDLFIQLNQSLDRAHGGLGIGLTLVRSLIEMHGGVVQAFSDGVGKGSEFVVRLPLSGGDSPNVDESLVLPLEPAAPSRILVVDDNVDVAESLAMVLQIHGHDVRLAHDGISALCEAEAFDPHVVFLDIGLPGIDGYETARRVRKGEPTSLRLLVAISGYGQDDDIRRSLEAGFDRHLVKPVAPDALVQLLTTVADNGPVASAS